MPQFVTVDRATLEQIVGALDISQALLEFNKSFHYEKVLAAYKALRAALANAETAGWHPIETAPATANNVLAFSESGNMKIETGFWLINMLHAANVDGEKCNYTHWMPLPTPPKDTP